MSEYTQEIQDLETRVISVVCNAEWMKKNEQRLKELFPENWTHAGNLNPVFIGFQLKLLGVDWRSEVEYAAVLVYFKQVGIIKVDGLLVKRGEGLVKEINWGTFLA